MIQFLFRKSKSNVPISSRSRTPLREEKTSKQWTNKLASLAETTSIGDSSSLSSVNGIPDSEKQTLETALSAVTSLRLEGPYFTPAHPSLYDTVICLVAGTGVSGAIAIAAAFSARSNDAAVTPPVAAVADAPREKDDGVMPDRGLWKRCIILWSVREVDYIKIPFLQEDMPGLEMRSHLTGPGHERLDAYKTLSDIREGEPEGKMWVYISGPNPFIEVGEKAARVLGMDYYGARWS